VTVGLTFVDVALTAFRDVSAACAGSFLVDTGALVQIELLGDVTAGQLRRLPAIQLY
jgi:hypothetical protein